MSRFFRILRLMAMPCRDMMELASRSLDDDLDFAERLAFKSHLLYCTACRRCRRQLAALTSAVRQLAKGLDHGDDVLPALSPDARRRIVETLQRL